ncbi:MAG: DUF6714 family protein [Capsulimonas sp.]|uniref:DUF6714 family protein n=1 Tax=Capsulimonas sp. TaxID=2494211 RepID=UPI0032654947
MTRIELEMLIKRAFHGVTLDGGHTLVDMNEMSNWGKRASKEEIESTSRVEFGANWTVLPVETLHHFFPTLAHADAKAMRYYLPAFMVSLLTHPDPWTHSLITVLSALCPESSDPEDYHIRRYALFDDKQRSACALYLSCLPDFVDLDRGSKRTVDQARSRYWDQHLPSEKV